MTYNSTNTLLLPAQHINRKAPENYREGELDFCKQEFSYDTRATELMTFKNCYVNFNGNLYNKNYEIVEASLVVPWRHKKLSWFRHFKKIVLKPKRRLERGKKYLLAFDEWSNNHYHWINDLLPRLVILADSLQNYTLLLPDTPYGRNVGVKLFTHFDLQPDGIEWIKQGEMVKVPDLSLITSVALSGKTHDELARQLNARIERSSLVNGSAPWRRIYVSRQKAPGRKVLNEDEVIAMLKQYDFEVVNFEDYTIEQQIQLANSTAVLVAMHGAGLANAIFMQPGTAVVEFRRDKIYHNQCYWHLSSALGQKYYYLFGQPDSDEVLEGIPGCNLTIPVEKLRSIIQNIVKK